MTVTLVGSLVLGFCVLTASEGQGSAKDAAAPRSVAASQSRTPTATPAARVSGLRLPIEGACLPESDQLMPNAPRPYRNGVHEGVDFYDGYVCVTIGERTAVIAARDGVVTLATLGYRDLTLARWEKITSRSQAAGGTSEEDLFVLRGRQVEIEHGDSVRTRYAHLSAIAEGIRVRGHVRAGKVIGYVGNSGTYQSITCRICDLHLHFEIWIGDTFLGRGLPAEEVRELYEQAFSR